MSTLSKEIEVFYDGACPLCTREITLLRKLDRKQRIGFIDISRPDFVAEQVGIPWQELMGEIHGRLPDGSLIKGVEVFRRLYAAVGFAPLVALTRLKGISHLLEAGYKTFARHRLRLTGRCDDARCELPKHV